MPDEDKVTVGQVIADPTGSDVTPPVETVQEPPKPDEKTPETPLEPIKEEPKTEIPPEMAQKLAQYEARQAFLQQTTDALAGRMRQVDPNFLTELRRNQKLAAKPIPRVDIDPMLANEPYSTLTVAQQVELNARTTKVEIERQEIERAAARAEELNTEFRSTMKERWDTVEEWWRDLQTSGQFSKEELVAAYAEIADIPLDQNNPDSPLKMTKLVMKELNRQTEARKRETGAPIAASRAAVDAAAKAKQVAAVGHPPGVPGSARATMLADQLSQEKKKIADEIGGPDEVYVPPKSFST